MIEYIETKKNIKFKTRKYLNLFNYLWPNEVNFIIKIL
jgi:hypothetical protein